MPARTLLLLALVFACHAAENASKPDVLIVMLDDSGMTDFGCYGSEIDTPRIDAFAKEGIRFNDCHAAAPNCSPSRAGMLTGRFPSRVGMYSYIPPNHPMHLRDQEVTIAEVLKTQDYATGHFGKWHLSNLEAPGKQPGPNQQGFDHSLGTSNNATPSHLNPVNFVRNGKPIGKVEGYACQIVADETIAWLKQRSPDERLFACVWFHEPHSRIASPPELVAKYKKRHPGAGKKQADYYANIENVDIAFGRILDQLEKMGREDNTFVFLTSDNGGMNSFSNRGLRGRKSFVYEGGQREAGILRWPTRLEPGQVSDTTICHIDLLPTLCDLTGAERPTTTLDGSSWVPMLDGKPFVRETPLFWYFYRVAPAAALRDGDYIILGHLEAPAQKHNHPLTAAEMPYVKEAGFERFELYNLKRDLAQEHDLASREPERLATMKRKLVALRREVLEKSPVWKFERQKR